MSDSNPVSPAPSAALERERERCSKLLCEHYTRDHLTDADLEQRLDGVHHATSLAALRELTSDLPDLADSAVPAVPGWEGTRASHEVVAAVMGGTERTGGWTPPEKITVAAVMGGACLDFREARLPPGVTEVRVFAIWGGVEILVPPRVRVEVNGIAVMGGFSGGGAGSGEAHPGPDAPVLRIGGVVLMAGVDVQVRYPGEGRKEAARRRKEERHRLRGG